MLQQTFSSVFEDFAQIFARSHIHSQLFHVLIEDVSWTQDETLTRFSQGCSPSNAYINSQN